MFLALVGWPFVILFLVSGGAVDTDFDVDTDVDLDADVDLDVDSDLATSLDVDSGSVLGTIASWVSFRSLVFFAAFAGLTGVVLGWQDVDAVATAVAAAGMGVFAVWLNRQLIRYIRRTSSDSILRDGRIAGLPGVVAIPFHSGSKGKISVDIDGQRLSLVAESFRADDLAYAVGDSIVIVELDRGIARIAPLEDIE